MFKRIVFATALLILGCNKQDSFSPVYKVPAEFEPYITKFIDEAAARGHSSTINNLIIQYDSSLSPIDCATSNIVSAENNVQKIISINPTKCWQNDAQLETLIFHELGHCFLGREHDRTLLPKGDAKSIMIPNDIALYSPCVYDLGDTSCDKRYRRTYYLDELFDANTPIPDWGK